MLKFIFRNILSIFVLLYRVTNGRLGGRVQGLPVLLLTTTGRRTGRHRTVPLGYFHHGSDYVVSASNAGFDPHPGWFHNLRDDPRVTIQVLDRRLPASAEPADPELRKQLWDELTQLAPGYAPYQKRTTREIPMVLLHPESETEGTTSTIS